MRHAFKAVSYTFLNEKVLHGDNCLAQNNACPRPLGSHPSALVKLIRIILAPAVGALACALNAQQAPELSADSPIAYSEETGLLTASGNAVFSDENTIVEADLIRYNRKTERVEATGSVSVTREGLRLLADSLQYDAQTRSFEATDFRIGYPPLFIEGKAFKGTLSEVDFEGITVFFREPVQNAPRIRVKSGRWVEDEFLRAEGIRLDVFGGIGLPLPAITYAFGKPDLQVEASLGYADYLGIYAQSAWLYPTSPLLSLGGNVDLYSQRGILVGPRLNWKSADGLLSIQMDTGWIQDQSSIDRGLDQIGNRIDPDRGFAKVELDARSETANLQTKVRAEVLSDSEILRDFRENRYLEHSQPDAFADFTWQEGNLLLNAFVRSRLNDGYAFVERLPDLSLEWLPAQVFSTGFYLQAQARATRYRQYAPEIGQILFPETPFYSQISEASTTNTIFSRLDTVATLTRPILLPAGIQLVLRGATRWTRWDEDGGDLADERAMGELGWDLKQTRTRTFNLDWKALQIEQLVHLSSLQLQHRWHRFNDEQFIPPVAVDTFSYRPYAPLMDLADMRQLDTLRDGHHVRLGWENTVYAKGSEEALRQLLTIRIYQDFVETNDASNLETDALYSSLEFRPAQWLSLGWHLKFQPEEFQTEASYFNATIRSADLWELDLQTEFIEGAIQQYAFQGAYRISENIGLLAAAQYDALIGAWSRQRYGISRRFGNVWQLDMYLSFTDADQRQDKVSVGLRVNWLSF
jgi:hypothetical protein